MRDDPKPKFSKQSEKKKSRFAEKDDDVLDAEFDYEDEEDWDDEDDWNQDGHFDDDEYYGDWEDDD